MCAEFQRFFVWHRDVIRNQSLDMERISGIDGCWICWFGWQPQDAYGLQKLATEELCKHYTKDLKMECRIQRFHSIYGPFST
jgi:nucleoside-diphosphate-sugar epimerase